MNKLSTISAFVFLMLLANGVSAATLSVDQGDASCDDVAGTPFCTVQAAIDAAAATDDVIEIAPGTYTENLVINDKSIALQGAGRDLTVLDGNQLHRVISIVGVGTPLVLITSLTVRGGRADANGGGISYGAGMGGGASISDCLIADNVAGVDGSNTGSGGGVWFDNGALFVENTTFSGNVAGPDPTDTGSGGAVWLNLGGLFLGVEFVDNVAASDGGGLASDAGNLLLADAVFENNQAVSGDGGGLFNDVGGTTNMGGLLLAQEANVFRANEAGNNGGAFCCGELDLDKGLVEMNSAAGEGGGLFGTAVNVQDSVIQDNQAVLGGGGIRAATATLTDSSVTDNLVTGGVGGGIYTIDALDMTDSLLARNRAEVISMPTTEGFGGGAYLTGSDLELLNTTVSGNSAATSGGGLYIIDTTGSPHIRFSTVTDNVADADEDGNGLGGGLVLDGTGSVRIKSSIFAGNESSTTDPDCFSAATASLITWGYNLIGELSPDCTLTPTTSFTPGPDLMDVPADLEELKDNGGLTQTHALLTSSPARDGSDCVQDVFIGNFAVEAVADQRGAGRPDQEGGLCDIGAFELQTTDLSVTKEDDADDAGVTPGTEVTYTIRATNNGPATAYQVVVTDPLPDGLEFVSAEASQGECEEADGAVTCGMGDVNAGNTVTAKIVATAADVGLFENKAFVEGSDEDPDLSNNEATVETTVVESVPPPSGGGGGCSLIPSR